MTEPIRETILLFGAAGSKTSPFHKSEKSRHHILKTRFTWRVPPV
jgi:hypothetical protein